MNVPEPRRPEPSPSAPLERTGTAFEATRLGSRSLAPGAVWVFVLAAAAAFGLGGRLLPASAASPTASAQAPAALATATGRDDALAKQCLEWERVYREIHPTTMTEAERAYYDRWQRQYEQQHPQDPAT